MDHAQYRTGLILLELFELAEIGSKQAIDLTKEAVDGHGTYVEPIIDDRSGRQTANARNLSPVNFWREADAIRSC
jgi:hypothetical protein